MITSTSKIYNISPSSKLPSFPFAVLHTPTPGLK